jgi:hypothetical protein
VASRVRWLNVACDVGGAATDNAVDNLPLRGLCGLHVCGEGELARATTVNGGADEGDLLSLTGIPLVHLGNLVDTGALLARPVARCERRAVESSLAVRNGVLEDHVRGRTGSECQKGGSLGEHLVMYERVCEKLGISRNR